MQKIMYLTEEGDNLQVLRWQSPEDPWGPYKLAGETIRPLILVTRFTLDAMAINETQTKEFTLSNGNYFRASVTKTGNTTCHITAGSYLENYDPGDPSTYEWEVDNNYDMEYGEAGILTRLFFLIPAIVDGTNVYCYKYTPVDSNSIEYSGDDEIFSPDAKLKINDPEMYIFIPSISDPPEAETFYGDAETTGESFDPFEDATDEPIGGGGGTFDYSGNPPGDDTGYTFPTISAADAGFITIYNPTTAELKQLSSYLWSNGFNLDSLKKLFNNPMDLFLSLAVLPVPIPDGGRAEVGIGLIHTGVTMTKASSQWVSLVCGSVTIPKLTGSYLDYDPYTSVQIYLPFVGVKTLRADEVVGRTLRVAYKIDILSGACVAWISVDNHVIYSFMGQCSMPVPMNSSDSSGIFAGLASIVAGAAVGAAKGGGAGAIAGGLAAASSVAVADGKIDVTRSGTIASTGGFLAHKKPFLIINAPRLRATPNQQKYEGYPSYWTYKLANLSGFTIVEQINLSNVHATEDELSEIKQLLMSGVIL